MNGVPHGFPDGGNPLGQLSLDQLRPRTSFKWREYPEDVLPLFVAEMDVPLAEPVARARRPTSPGWTAVSWASATTRPPPSSTVAGWRSTPARPSAPAVPAMCG